MAAAEEEPEQPLSESLMDLSNIGRTVKGDGFTYRTLSCVGKRIGVVKCIEAYVTLQHVDLSNNCVKDLAPFKVLQYAITINLSHNQIASLKAWEPPEDGELFPYLANLNLSHNLLTALPPLPLKALKTVSFTKNSIEKCQDFTGHEKIESLDLSDNMITSLTGIANMPALTKLNLSSNQLEDINGLEGVPLLEDLNLARNNFKALEGPWQGLAALKTLDLSTCQLADTKPLEVLRNLSKLRALDIKENPFVETAEAGARVEALICHWRLGTIDGEKVKDEELEKARGLNVQRLEEEARRKAEEEAAAAAAEAEG